MSERVIVEHRGAVAHVRLNRPAQKNALDIELIEALVHTAEDLKQTVGVRAVVLSGAGGCFCAGLDLNALLSGGPALVAKLLGERIQGANLAQRVGLVWQEVPVPVIAAIDGVAYGGGLQIAGGADFRIAAPNARVSFMEARYGLIPDMGITQSFGPLVRTDHLRELAFTGRVVQADEALTLGLISRIADDPIAAALELAETIAGKNPDAVRANKRMLQGALGLDSDTALQLETDLQRPLLGSANQMEAVAAWFGKRPAVFTDPQP